MCGIVGYVGTRDAVGVLLSGLKRLEYRGYDSAGLAVFRDGKLDIRKSEGKLEKVEKLFSADSAQISRCGIGHTRWATHGRPTTQNAHPHRTGDVVLVHNGIIENYQEIRRDLIARGHRPASETDSELFGFLVLEEMNAGQDLVSGVRRAFLKLQGACSVVVMSEREPGVIVGVRNGSPLVAAIDPQGGALLASDAQAVIEVTRDVVFLENGDVAVGDSHGLRFYGLSDGKPRKRPTHRLDWSVEKMDRGGYAHYMLKEIHEQPAAIVDTLNGLLDRARATPFPLAAQPGVDILAGARELQILACGTSWHAALLGKYWLERFARLPVSVELASEFRYREPVINAGAAIVGISQSGETADTLAVIRDMRAKGVPTLALTNVRGSTMAREANAAFFTCAGPEIGVAATKTFMTQLTALLTWAGYLGIRREGTSELATQLFSQLVRLPHALEQYLTPDGAMVSGMAGLARELKSSKGFFFIGRGTSYPVALEGALKLKEIAYVHAEGYAAGELKHGPIAMIDEGMTVVVLAPRDPWRDKTVSNLEEVKARGARIVGVGSESDRDLRELCEFWVPVPETLGSTPILQELMPFFLTPAVQLLSYELAKLHGTDVDKPRNLAKSVTVE